MHAVRIGGESSRAQMLEPKGECVVQAAENDLEPADHPDERQRTAGRLRHRDDAVVVPV